MVHFHFAQPVRPAACRTVVLSTRKCPLGHPAAADATKTPSSCEMLVLRSAMICLNGLSAPSAISRRRCSSPCAYFGTSSPFKAPARRRAYASALRAKWVRTCPMLHPGRRLRERISCSVRRSALLIKRACASLQSWDARCGLLSRFTDPSTYHSALRLQAGNEEPDAAWVNQRQLAGIGAQMALMRLEGLAAGQTFRVDDRVRGL